MPVIINKETCTGCGACVPSCPVEAISMESDKAVIDHDKCIECGACIGECSVSAISQE